MLLSGSMGSSPNPDNSKEVGSYVVAIAAGAGVAQAITPAVSFQAMTVNNATRNLIRATLTLTTGVDAVGIVTTRCILIPPMSPQSIDLSDGAGNNAPDSIAAIASVSFAAVIAGTTTNEASTLALATAAAAGNLYVNFASA